MGICKRCGSQFARARKFMAGSFGMEFVLWLLFILPGILYSVWRLTTKAKVCPRCGSANIIPLDTPEGRRIEAAHMRPCPTCGAPNDPAARFCGGCGMAKGMSA